MKKELQDKLFKKYPKIFIQKDLDMTKTAMCWGIQCGDGWYTLLDCLCFELQNLADNGEVTYKCYPFGEFFSELFKNTKLRGRTVNKPLPQIVATTIKEKFGTLRFYNTGYCEQSEALISYAETLSAETCEECGSTGDASLTEGVWLKTLCKRCKSNIGLIDADLGDGL